MLFCYWTSSHKKASTCNCTAVCQTAKCIFHPTGWLVTEQLLVDCWTAKTWPPAGRLSHRARAVRNPPNKETLCACLCVCVSTTWMTVCVCVCVACPCTGGVLLLAAVTQYTLYNNCWCVGGSRHLERCNPDRAWHYALTVCACVCVCTFVFVCVHK